LGKGVLLGFEFKSYVIENKTPFNANKSGVMTMVKRTYSKILGTFIGILTIIVTLGFGFLFLIGMGLNRAFSTELDRTPTEGPILLILIMLVISGFITAIGPFSLKKTAGKVTFVGYCFILGFVGLVVFFISAGALGNGFEYTILSMGIAYFLLGYFILKEK
jgi:hypothetical protein